ncbi:hypothetical protein HKD37_03G007211 [Glycine soja]|nr:hypothetical protein GmHk_03G007263 [Glycine max]
MDEHQQNWKEMTNIMMKINKESDEMSFAIRWTDKLKPTWHLIHSSGNMHSVTYNQDLVSPSLLAGWTKLREFYGLTGNHLVTLTHYGQTLNQKLFLNGTPSLYRQVPNLITFKVILTRYKVTCKNLVRCAEYHVIIYESYKIHSSELGRDRMKTTKIGNGWRTFVQTQNLLPGTQIIFELQDATSNFVLF